MQQPYRASGGNRQCVSWRSKSILRFQALVRRIDPGAISRRGRPRKAPANGPNPLELLPDIGERRLKSMDEAGITVQVLAKASPRGSRQVAL